MSSRRSRKSKVRKSSKNCSLRRVAWGSLIFLAFLLSGIFFAYNAVRTYLRGDAFRAMLGSQAGEFLEGEARFQPFQWDGWNVSTSRFSFSGEDGLQDLDALGIDASIDIGAVWGGVYRIEDIRVREIELIGDFTERARERKEEKFEVIPIDGGRASGAGFWQAFLPDKLEITGIKVAAVNGRALTDDGVWAWKDTSVTAVPGAISGVYEVTFQGGEISTPLSLVDRLTLKNAVGRYSGDRFYLLSSDFTVLENARVTLAGDYGMEDRHWHFDGAVRGARIEEVIAEDWKQRLMGPLALSFKVTGQPDHDAHLRGNLKIADGVLTALPVLDRIAAYANTTRFRRLALSEAQLDFSKIGSKMELTDIRLASEGLVRLEGSMRLNGDLIERGEFRVGITPGTLAHLPGAETKVFQPGELGLLWTPLAISGTLDSPQEDLSERLIAAAGERMFEIVPETGQWALKYSGQAIGESTRLILENQGVILDSGQKILDQANGLLRKGTDQAIEKGSGLIEEGVGTLFDLFGRPLQKKD